MSRRQPELISRSRVAGEKAVGSVDVECPVPLVEGAPVADFETVQTVAMWACGAFRVGGEFGGVLGERASKSASHWASTNALTIRRTSKRAPCPLSCVGSPSR